MSTSLCFEIKNLAVETLAQMELDFANICFQYCTEVTLVHDQKDRNEVDYEQ